MTLTHVFLAVIGGAAIATAIRALAAFFDRRAERREAQTFRESFRKGLR